MQFSEAAKHLRNGEKVKAVKWRNAYWYLSGDKLINHDERGKETPIEKDSNLFLLSIIWVTTLDWEVVADKPKPKKKVFISQPMNGLSDYEIESVRNKAVAWATHHLGEEIEVVDSFFKDAPTDAKPLWYLGESLKKLAEADVAYFANDWRTARGCRIEHQAAKAYGIPIIHD